MARPARSPPPPLLLLLPSRLQPRLNHRLSLSKLMKRPSNLYAAFWLATETKKQKQNTNKLRARYLALELPYNLHFYTSTHHDDSFFLFETSYRKLFIIVSKRFVENFWGLIKAVGKKESRWKGRRKDRLSKVFGRFGLPVCAV